MKEVIGQFSTIGVVLTNSALFFGEPGMNFVTAQQASI